MPTASMSAYIVVGPTKANPLRLSAFDSASDSGEVVATRPSCAAAGCRGPEGPHERREVALRVIAQAQRRPRVRDRREDLRPVAHDPGVGHEPLDVAVVEGRDDLGVEAVERRRGTPGACAGSSPTTGPTGRPRGRAARTCRARRAPASPTRCRSSRAGAGRPTPRRPGQAVRADDDPGVAHDRLSVMIGGGKRKGCRAMTGAAGSGSGGRERAARTSPAMSAGSVVGA